MAQVPVDKDWLTYHDKALLDAAQLLKGLHDLLSRSFERRRPLSTEDQQLVLVALSGVSALIAEAQLPW